MIYRFADCELDTDRFELRRPGAVQRLEPQVFDLLRYLVERNDQFVSKDDIFAAVWQGRIVSDSALASRVRAARRAIGDSGKAQGFIRTLHKRGFRFVAPVACDADPAEGSSAGAPSTGAEPTGEPAFVQEIRYCTAPDGVRLAYATSGAGEPLVHAMSWLTHVELDWKSRLRRAYFEELSRGRLLLRYDGRGNGLSDWEVEDLSFEAMVNDRETVVDAAGLERFSIVTKSQGCAVAIAYAIRHPERLRSLVLIGGYAQGWRKRANAEEIKRRESLASHIEVGWGTNHPAYYQMFASLYFPDGLSAYVDSFIEMQRLSTSPANATRLYETFSAIDVLPLLDKVRTPTLVMHARGDAVAPFEQGRLLAAGIPGARFVPLDSNNHSILPAEPAWARLVQELRAFLPA